MAKDDGRELIDSLMDELRWVAIEQALAYQDRLLRHLDAAVYALGESAAQEDLPEAIRHVELFQALMDQGLPEPESGSPEPRGARVRRLLREREVAKQGRKERRDSRRWKIGFAATIVVGAISAASLWHSIASDGKRAPAAPVPAQIASPAPALPPGPAPGPSSIAPPPAR